MAVDKTTTFNSPPSVTVKSLSTSESLELVSSGTCQRFLRRFTAEYVASFGRYWGPVRLSAEDLTNKMKRSGKVMATFDKDGGHGISGLSFADVLLLKTKLKSGAVKVEVQYFGDSLDDLVDHIQAQMSHVAAISPGRQIILVLHFPLSVDREAAATMISRGVMQGIKHITETWPTAYLSSICRPGSTAMPVARLFHIPPKCLRKWMKTSRFAPL